MTRTRIFLIASLLTTVGGTPAGAADIRCAPIDTPVRHTHIRVIDPALTAAFDDGLRRSATLRDLVGRIETLDGIVLLFAGSAVNPALGSLSGAMSHGVVRAGSYRFIRVTVLPRRGPRTVATIAHELQHSIEVLESGVAGAADVTDLYRRIGITVRSGVFETDAARDAGYRALAELAKCS